MLNKKGRMSMKKLLSLILALSLVLGLSVSASAAANSMNNFKKTETYGNQFTDVAASYWAAASIKTCYEYSLMQGYDADSFVPKGNLTVAQAIVMADRVHEIYTTGQSTLANGAPWYQPYVDYAVENGIIQEGDFTNYNAQVTRAQMAYIFCNALPASALPAINDIQAIPDVNSSNPYASDILTLYKAGVLTGSDVYGTFKPNDNIIRAEAAAIIARVAIPAQRQNVTLLQDYTWNNVTLAVPTDVEEDYSNGMFGLVSDSSYTGVLLNTDYDAAYSGMSITLMTAAQLNDLLSTSMSGGGAALSNLNTKQVTFGAIKAYRTTCTMTMNGMAMDAVFYTYIANSSITMLCFVGSGDMDQSAVVLENMANHVRVAGCTVSPKL